MAGLVPSIADAGEFERSRRDHALWVPAVRAIAERHGLRGDLHPFSTGSVIVFGIGDDHVVKMHEPWHREHRDIEAQALSGLVGGLPVASPELHACGELEGWCYVVMQRLPGVPLSEARPKIPRRDLLGIAGAAGALASALAAVPRFRPFTPFSTWRDFITARRRDCVAVHRDNGLPTSLLATIEDQITGVALDIDDPVFLHTELTDTNLMVARVDGRWRLSGVFDFEPSMLGHPLYELPAVTIFVARGDPELCRAAVEGYGITAFDARLRRELLALTLLHRYSHIGFFLELVGVEDCPGSWPRIAELLLGF